MSSHQSRETHFSFSQCINNYVISVLHVHMSLCSPLSTTVFSQGFADGRVN